MANKTVKKADDGIVLESLCAELELRFETKKEADGEIKALKERIVEIINADRGRYFGGRKSFAVGSIKVSLKEDNTYALGEDFDLATFWSRYPRAVRFSLAHAELKNIDLGKWGVEHCVDENIHVALKEK